MIPESRKKIGNKHVLFLNMFVDFFGEFGRDPGERKRINM